MSFALNTDIMALSELMHMNVATKNEYKSFMSCFYLLTKKNYGSEDEPDLRKNLRFKLYNKWLHFLQSEQAKKKVGMNLKAMLVPSTSFYKKMQECELAGITRLEFSSYFYSFKE